VFIDKKEQFRKKRFCVFFACFILTVGIFSVFGQAVNYDFLAYDDYAFVANNPHIKEGLTKESLKWAFTSTHACFWKPVTWLSYLLDIEIFGTSPFGFHFTNIILHYFNTLLLFAVLYFMTGALWPCVAVGLLFGIHPLHVESVAWVSERKDVLSTFFMMLAVGAYGAYVKIPSWRRYGAVTLFFILGLMAKPMLVTLPFIFLLLDYWPLNRTRLNPCETSQTLHLSTLIKEKIPFFVLAIGFCILTAVAQQKCGALASVGDIGFELRIKNALVSYFLYLKNTVFPSQLSIFYPYPDTIPLWAAGGAAIFILLVSIGILCFHRNCPWLVTGWFWYLGTLIPVIGLVQSGDFSMADRFTYIPLVGIFIMFSWTAQKVWTGRPALKKWIILFFGVAILVLGAVGYRQAEYFKNSLTLFERAVSVNPDNWLALNNLGITYNEMGKHREGIQCFQKALAIKPVFVEALNNLAGTFVKTGRIEEGLGYYRRAIELMPNFSGTYYNLAVALEASGRLKNAEDSYKKVLKMNPQNAEALNNLGVIQGRLQRTGEGMKNIKKALEINPNYAEAHYNMGNLFLNRSMPNKAVYHYAKAIRIRPEYAEAYNNFGVALFSMNRLMDSIRIFESALKIRPDYPNAQANLEMARGKLD